MNEFGVPLISSIFPAVARMIIIVNMNILFLFTGCFVMVAGNVLRLALSGVAPTPSHYKYNKTFHSAADFP